MVSNLYLRKKEAPDFLDYCFRSARGEFSFFAYEDFEKRLGQKINMIKRGYWVKEKLNA